MQGIASIGTRTHWQEGKIPPAISPSHNYCIHNSDCTYHVHKRMYMYMLHHMNNHNDQLPMYRHLQALYMYAMSIHRPDTKKSIKTQHANAYCLRLSSQHSWSYIAGHITFTCLQVCDWQTMHRCALKLCTYVETSLILTLLKSHPCVESSFALRLYFYQIHQHLYICREHTSE